MRTRSKRNHNQGKRIYSESFKYYEDDDDTETEQDVETEEEDASDQIQEKENDEEYNCSSSSEEEELSDFTEYEETPKNKKKKKKPNPPPTEEELENNSSIIHHRNTHDQKHLLKNKTINKKQINLNESSPINLLTPPSKPATSKSYDEDDVIILSDSSPNTIIIDIMSDSSVEHSLIGGQDFPPSPPPLFQENISLFEPKTDSNERVGSSSNISNSDATLQIADNTEPSPPLLEPIEEFQEKVPEDDNISIDFNEILEVIKPVKGRSKVSLAIREVEQLLGDDPSNSEESMEEIDRKILSAFSKMDSSLKPKLLEFLNSLHTNPIVN